MIKHNFTIKEIFTSAWSKTKEHAWFLFWVFLAAVILTSVTRHAPLLGFFVNLIMAIAVTAVSLVIVHDKTPTFNDLTKSFKSYKITLHYIIATILYVLVVMVGIIAFVLPGIYLAIRLGLYKFLVIEHENMSPMNSLKESMKITKGYFWKLFGLNLALIIFNLLGAALFMVGLIVTIPVSVIVSAYLYKKLSTPHTEHVHTA